MFKVLSRSNRMLLLPIQSNYNINSRYKNNFAKIIYTLHRIPTIFGLNIIICTIIGLQFQDYLTDINDYGKKYYIYGI